MSTTIDLDTIKRQWIEQGHTIANQLNASAATDFINAAKNRAANWLKVQSPKPEAPFAVEPVFSFDPKWSMELVQTALRVTPVDPDSFLPDPPATDVGAVGGPVGSPINDPNDPVQGKFHMASTDNTAPGTLWVSPTGRKFVKIAEGFAGLRRYWLELK